MKNVYLIGLMGSGKTTLGRILAQRVHRKHVDTDDLIETYFSMAIPQVFAEKREDAFRDGETEVLLPFVKTAKPHRFHWRRHCFARRKYYTDAKQRHCNLDQAGSEANFAKSAD